MFANWFGLFTLIVIVVVSARSYDHRERNYARGKANRLPSLTSFAAIYRLVQASTLAFGVLAFTIPHPWLRVHEHPAFVFAGSGLALVGLVLFVRAKTTLGAEYSPCFDAFAPAQIVRTGIYRRVRHPIYTGNLIVLTGLAVATGSPVLAGNLLVVAIYYHRSARAEERLLAERFADYRDYLHTSGRFLPPMWSRQRAREVV